MEVAGGVADADGNGDRLERAGADESGGASVEVQERVGVLASVDEALIAQSNHRVGEAGSLLGCVDLLGDGGERVPAPVGIVVFDRFRGGVGGQGRSAWGG